MSKLRVTGTLAIAIIASFSIILSGCGGGGKSSPASVASIYQGNWGGQWIDGQGSQGGLNVTVGANGKFTGLVMDFGSGLTGTASGTLANNGQLTATYAYTGYAPISTVGTVAMNSLGNLAGNLTATQGNVSVPVALELSPR